MYSDTLRACEQCITVHHVRVNISWYSAIRILLYVFSLISLLLIMIQIVKYGIIHRFFHEFSPVFPRISARNSTHNSMTHIVGFVCDHSPLATCNIRIYYTFTFQCYQMGDESQTYNKYIYRSILISINLFDIYRYIYRQSTQFLLK